MNGPLETHRGTWLPHLAALLVMVLTGALHLSRHRDAAELQAAAAPDRPTAERLVALHTLLSRPEADERTYGLAFARALQLDPDPRVREYAMTSDVARFQPRDGNDVPYQLEEVLFGTSPLPLDAAWWRTYVFYRRKVGGKQVGGRKRLNLPELAWYRTALRGEELPTQDLYEYLVRRVNEIQRTGGVRRGQ